MAPPRSLIYKVLFPSISTSETPPYAEIDLEMKAKALARCDVPSMGEPTPEADWHKDPELMAFLKGL